MAVLAVRHGTLLLDEGLLCNVSRWHRLTPDTVACVRNQLTPRTRLCVRPGLSPDVPTVVAMLPEAGLIEGGVGGGDGGGTGGSC